MEAFKLHTRNEKKHAAVGLWPDHPTQAAPTFVEVAFCGSPPPPNVKRLLVKEDNLLVCSDARRGGLDQETRERP